VRCPGFQPQAEPHVGRPLRGFVNKKHYSLGRERHIFSKPPAFLEYYASGFGQLPSGWLLCPLQVIDGRCSNRLKADFNEAKSSDTMPHVVWLPRARYLKVFVLYLPRKGIRISHPYGLRHWRAANSSGPWLDLSPRKSSVPDRVQMKPRSDLWFPAVMAGQP
jgi:hypothetical protein